MFKKTPDVQLDDRLKAVETRLDEIERAHRSLDLEWSETYDKLRKLYARLAKRDQRALAADEDTNGGKAGVEPAPDVSPLAQRLLGLKGG